MNDVSIMTMAGQTGRELPLSGHDRTYGKAAHTDRAITAMAVGGVTALTALGWVLSYAPLRQLALSAGMPPWAATLWPLCVDLFVFVATLAAISGRRRRRPTSYAWTLAVLYSAGTVAGNVLAAGQDHLAQAVHATPAVTMVLAWHLLSGFSSGGHDRSGSFRVRTDDRDSGDRSGEEEPVRRLVLKEVAAWVAEHEAAGRRPTGDQLAARVRAQSPAGMPAGTLRRPGRADWTLGR
jgi:hypothetical protein